MTYLIYGFCEYKKDHYHIHLFDFLYIPFSYEVYYEFRDFKRIRLFPIVIMFTRCGYTGECMYIILIGLGR